jgi:hypothetical protein
MQKANINDRHTVEAVYPLEVFEEDAARNALDKSPVIHGVRIDSVPDAQGWFVLVRARRHVGKLTGSREAVFLPATEPHLSAPMGSDPNAGTPQRREGTAETRRQEYEAFVERILDEARSADIPEPIGREETRLQGFRGG